MKVIDAEYNATLIPTKNEFMCGLCILHNTDDYKPAKETKGQRLLLLTTDCPAYLQGKPQSILDGGDCEWFDGKGLGKGSGRGVLERLSECIYEIDGNK